MITKKEWEIIMEREGLDSFIQARHCNNIDEMGTNVFETENGFFGVVYEISVFSYPGQETFTKIQNLLGMDLPKDTVVHFFKFVSKNIDAIIKKATVMSKINNSAADSDELDKAQVIEKTNEFNLSFFKEKTEKSLLESHNLKYFINNQRNFITIMIPAEKENGETLSEVEVKTFFSKAASTMSQFSPRSLRREEYVELMQELLNSNPHTNIASDETTPIKHQCVNADTAVRLKDDGVIAFGETEEFKTQIEERNKTGFLGSILNKTLQLFGVNRVVEKHNFENKMNEKKYLKMLTKKIFPKNITLYESADLFSNFLGSEIAPLIPESYFISLVVKIEDPEKTKKDVLADAKWNKFQLTALGSLSEYLPSLSHRANEADIAIQMIDKGQIPMKAAWSAGVFGDNELEIDKTIATLISKLKSIDWIVQEDKFLSLPSFLYSLPLMYDDIFSEHSHRFTTMYRANAASLSPMYSDAKGFGDPVMMFVGRNGQAQAIDLFSEAVSVKNFIIVANSGAGKSVLTQEIARCYANNGVVIRIIDRGGSYKKLCKAFGGEFIDFDDKTCFNFLDGAVTDSNNQLDKDEIEKFIPIVGKMGGRDLTVNPNDTTQDESSKATISSYVAEALRDAYAMGGRKEGEPAGMKEIGVALKHIFDKQLEKAEKSNNEREVDEDLRNFVASIQRFSNPDGDLYTFFNGRSTVNFKNKLVCFDMQTLSKYGDLFKSLIVMININNVKREFFYMDKSIKKMLFVDEAWDLMSDRVTANFFQGASRTVRKHNALLGTITNSLLDITMSDAAKIMYENAGWKIFLAQDKGSLQKAIDDGTLPMDRFNLELIKSLETRKRVFSEILFIAQSGSSMISRHFLPQELYWIYTSDAEDNAFLDEVSASFGVDLHIAAIAIAKYKKEYPINGLSMKEAIEFSRKLFLKGTEDGMANEIVDILQKEVVVDDNAENN